MTDRIIRTSYQQDLELWRSYLRTGDLKYVTYIERSNLEYFYRVLTKKSLKEGLELYQQQQTILDTSLERLLNHLQN